MNKNSEKACDALDFAYQFKVFVTVFPNFILLLSLLYSLATDLE